MTGAAPHDGRDDDLMHLLQAAEDSVASGPNALTSGLGDVAATLDRIETATPFGPALHAQLDTVRKWLRVLARPSEHERFGGEAHVRGYVLSQLRLVRAALENYRREMK